MPPSVTGNPPLGRGPGLFGGPARFWFSGKQELQFIVSSTLFFPSWGSQQSMTFCTVSFVFSWQIMMKGILFRKEHVFGRREKREPHFKGMFHKSVSILWAIICFGISRSLSTSERSNVQAIDP
jgi:hypothetical protein